MKKIRIAGVADDDQVVKSVAVDVRPGHALAEGLAFRITRNGLHRHGRQSVGNSEIGTRVTLESVQAGV